ncbi:MAG: hypothetical protein JHC19_01655, partial [Desulfurococcaceae archaeon]|nr:hypothetical protein [Desulfurococcaceae archaeon]
SVSIDVFSFNPFAERISTGVIERISNIRDRRPRVSRDVAHIILPVSVLKDLHGIRFDSLIASSCDDNNTLIIPKLVPRKFFRTFLSPINATILMPDVDDGIFE